MMEFWLSGSLSHKLFFYHDEVLAIVGEFRKTHHPRNAKFDKVLETCFQEEETHDFRKPGTREASNS
jgi:hypothetical protein